MKHLMLLAVAFALSGEGRGQNWRYQSGPGGTPPFMYGGPYGAGGTPGYGGPGTSGVPTYSVPPSFTVPPLPQVPQIRGYVPEPSHCPANYPCTLPGGRQKGRWQRLSL